MEGTLTLVKAISNHYNIHGTGHRDIFVVRAICKQLYKRWTALCEVHQDKVEQVNELGLSMQGRRFVPALPASIVQPFVSENIAWAQSHVFKRFSKIFFGVTEGNADYDDGDYDDDADV